MPALDRAPGHLPFPPLCHADRTSTRPETAGPTRNGGPRQSAHLLATILRASCADTSSVPGPHAARPAWLPAPPQAAQGPGRLSGGRVHAAGSLAHFFPLSVQLLPELLQSRLLPGIQGSLLSLLRGLQLFPELLQHLSAPLLQAGPLGPLERLQLFSQPLQGSLLLGPERTDRRNGPGPCTQGAAPGGRLTVRSPDAALVCFRAGLHLGPELGQPPALLLSHLSLLLLCGLPQLFLQGTGTEKTGKFAGGTTLPFVVNPTLDLQKPVAFL